MLGTAATNLYMWPYAQHNIVTTSRVSMKIREVATETHAAVVSYKAV